MEKEETAKALKELANKGLKKLKEQNIPDKLKTLKDKGLEKLKEQNISEKLNTLKDKGLEAAKEAYDKNKSADAGWRKFFSTHPKVKYALYAVLGLFVLGWIFDSEVEVTNTENNEVQQQKAVGTQQNKTHKSDNSKKKTINNSEASDTSGSINEKGSLSNAYTMDELKCKYEKFTPVYCEDFRGNIINGYVKQYYDSGKLHSILSYESGMLNGTQRIYYESGNLFQTSDYLNGKLEGSMIKYYENGNVEFESHFIMGKEVSSMNYDQYGRLTHTNGKPTGWSGY